MNSDEDRTQLHSKIDALSPMGVRFVARLVDSLSTPPEATPGEESWIGGTDDWVEYFGYSLASHHGITTEPLGLTSFEVAFRDACGAVGWETSAHVSATQRFVDLTVSADNIDHRLSLKSTAAQRLSRTTVHISKLTEAAWIQDMRSARDRRDQTLELFREYQDAVDAIVMLRAFRSGAGHIPHQYELIEIPAAIFDSLQDSPLSAFESDNPTIDCRFGDEEAAARVLLDRSDAKITVKQIKLSVCTVHVRWALTTGDENP